MNWLEKLITFLMNLFNRAEGIPPVTPPIKPPSEPLPDPQPGIVRRFPSGQIKTKGPGGRDLSHISWSTISRWDPLFKEAQESENAAFDRLLLECFAVIESEGNHYTTGGMAGRDQDVIRGHGDPRSRGLLQIRHDLHDPQMAQLGSAAHIRLGTKLLSQWIKSEGSWEAALANKWHPGTDPASQTTREEYIRTVRDLIKEVKASWDIPPVTPPSGGQPVPVKKYAVAGLANPIAIPLPAGVGFRQHLTPFGANRSGRQLNWTGTTQHTTNNQNGMGAEEHAEWQESGTPGNPGIGVHFYVDDVEVVQTIPVNEQGVHAGDWRNQQHVAVELCVRANGQTASPKAEANSIALMAGLLKHLGKTGKDAMHPHTANASGHCPRLSVSWSAWEQRVDAKIGEMP